MLRWQKEQFSYSGDHRQGEHEYGPENIQKTPSRLRVKGVSSEKVTFK